MHLQDRETPVSNMRAPRVQVISEQRVRAALQVRQSRRASAATVDVQRVRERAPVPHLIHHRGALLHCVFAYNINFIIRDRAVHRHPNWNMGSLGRNTYVSPHPAVARMQGM